MASEAEHGLATAAALALAEADAPLEPPAVQPGLFGGEIADADGPPQRRGPGRPAGSRNRNTEEWKAFILSRFRSPLLGLAELATTDPHDLVERFGMKPAEALGVVIRAAESLAPYLHAKQPQALEAPAPGGFQVIIQTAPAGEASGSVVYARPLENQALSDVADAMSEGGMSE